MLVLDFLSTKLVRRPIDYVGFAFESVTQFTIEIALKNHYVGHFGLSKWDENDEQSSCSVGLFLI